MMWQQQQHEITHRRQNNLTHHGFVVILEVNPSSQTLDRDLPLLRVARHNTPAVLVVRFDTHLENLRENVI